MIFGLSSIPARAFPQSMSPLWSFDKLAHAILFGGLGALVYRAVALGHRRAPSSQSLAWVIAVAVASLYGVLDEIHQRWTPGRSSDPKDALADLAGACMGA